MPSNLPRRAAGRALVLLSVVFVVVLSGCGSDRGGNDGSAGRAAEQSTDPEPSASVNPRDAATGVQPTDPVVVTAKRGTLSSVSVTDGAGRSLAGSMTSDGGRWTSTVPKRYATRYTVLAHTVDGSEKASVRSTFTTVRPRALAYPSVVPLRGETVGVGMVIRVMFSHPVGDKAATERLLEVTSAKPVTGAWRWFGDDEVHYRPKTYWPPYDKITLDINIGHLHLGGGVYGEASRHLEFQTGAAMLTRVSNATKHLQTYKDGRLAMTAPVSLGRPSKPSSSGTLLVMTVQHPYTMDSSTYGVPSDSPGGYRTTVQYALRLTNGGEFLHSAPWSVGQQGRVNVSHGCINVSPRVAAWFYANSHRGDVVVVEGTGHPVRPGDGWTDWRLSWAEWVAGSALR